MNPMGYCNEVAKELVPDHLDNRDAILVYREFTITLLGSGSLAELLQNNIKPKQVADYIEKVLQEWHNNKWHTKEPINLYLLHKEVSKLLSNPGLYELIKQSQQPKMIYMHDRSVEE